MNEDQRLAMLDARAAAARAALDEAVEQAPLPDHGLGTPTPRFRRLLPIAVAAGLAAIALVGAALILDDDDQSTIAGQPEAVTRLALADPESLGYRVVGAFDGRQQRGGTGPLDITMTIHSPADGPRWEAPVVSYSFSSDMTTLSGEVVDVGGPEAVLTTGGIPMIGWADGEDRVRFIGGPGYSDDELAALVTRTIAEGVPDGAPLPGHEIIHVAPYTDTFPAVALSAANVGTDVAGIAYESDGDGFAVTTAAGSMDRWRASLVLAVDTERLTVRGKEAVRADFGNGLTEVSWLEPDGTLVRASPFMGELSTEVLDHLEPITEGELADLVEEFGTDDSTETVHVFDETGEEIEGPETREAPEPILPDASTSSTTIDARTLIAEVSTEDGDLRVRATLLRGLDGFDLEIDAQDSKRGNGVGQSVPDTATNVVLRDELSFEEWSGVMVGGVIGPNVQSVEVIDPESGQALDGASTATIQDSDHVVFLTTVGDEYRGTDLEVVGTTTTGEEIRLRAPSRA